MRKDRGGWSRCRADVRTDRGRGADLDLGRGVAGRLA